MDERIFKHEEKAIFSLRSLYRKYGYLPYKMSKFEEYEYYIRNKDFLISDRIITFNDTNGKLLALKPDVTLSIVKNGEDHPGCKQKVYYNENIYRISETTGQYKEIMQAGVECIGDIGMYDIFEVLSLAAQSLALISEDYILQISHLGILSAVLNDACTDRNFTQKAIRYISGKNVHDLSRLCAEYSVSADKAQMLTAFTQTYGKRDLVIAKLEALCGGSADAALLELKTLSALLDTLPHPERIVFDFSVVNNMSYYNGIVFTGFLKGISDGVLAGGQYDKLMQKLQRNSGAIGFAVYLDLLEQLSVSSAAYDVDVLLLYSENTDPELVCENVQRLIAEGKTVSAQKSIPCKLRYKTVLEI
ncbi:MAG: ATP phosphoribosyltransferase regulatory subunit [Oscillospiraceae bacterium]|nr:ATP phosphoribosyltransferase regulatory subunit [Oscillospiraceae bacterium]